MTARPPRPSETWSARWRFTARLTFVFSLWLAYFTSAVSLMGRWNGGPGPGVGFGALGVLMIWSLTGFLSRDEAVLYRKDGEADRDTSLVLRPLARQGWRVIDYVRFHDGDIDHVLIGPGGVFAVETAWVADPKGGPSARQLHQARQGARKVELLLKSQGIKVSVRPVMVAWGPYAPYFEEGLTERDEVLLAAGPQAADWLPRLWHQAVEGELTDRICQAVERFAALRQAGRVAAA